MHLDLVIVQKRNWGIKTYRTLQEFKNIFLVEEGIGASIVIY
jgi:hypothetical protein